MKITAAECAAINYIDATIRREVGVGIDDLSDRVVRVIIKTRILRYIREGRLGTAARWAEHYVEEFVMGGGVC